MTAAATPKTLRARDTVWDLIQTVLIALALTVGVRFFIAQPFRIPSGSMQPTLLVGDFIVVTKWSYGYSRYSFAPFNFGPEGRVLANPPKRGDIIVFRPPAQPDRDLVKRLIGLPGDTVQVREGVLYINNTAVPRASLGPVNFKNEQGDVSAIPEYQETLPDGGAHITFDRYPNGKYDITPVFTVPAGHYFFMGDDRDNSEDSRSAEVGFVPFDHLVGKAQFVLMSFDPSRTKMYLPWTWVTGARGDRAFKALK